MATMGLRINDGGGIDMSTANLLAKAIFGDPDQAMRLKRLESDLATADLQRGQIASHTAYNQALKARQDWELAGMEAGVDGMKQIGVDYLDSTRQPGPVPVEAPAPVAAPVPTVLAQQPQSMPVPVELTSQPQTAQVPAQLVQQSPNVPIPATRPIDTLFAPDEMAHPDIQPLDRQPVPIPLSPEPDLRLSTYPNQTDLLPETGPIPGQRPGEFPPFQPNPQLAGPPPVVPDPPGAAFRRALDKMRVGSSEEDQGFIADLMDTLGLGQEVQPAAVPPDIGAGLDLPVNSPWRTKDDTLPTDQVPLSPDRGTVTNIPGRPRSTMPIPMSDEPVPVGEPYLEPGKPFMGPNVPLPETQPLETADPHINTMEPAPVEIADPHIGTTAQVPTEIADPHLNVNTPPVHPADIETTAKEVERQIGPNNLTPDLIEGLARMSIANGGDVSGTFQKIIGMAGLTYGDPSNGDKLRQSGLLATGQTPTQSTVVGLADTAGADVAAREKIAVDAADPAKLKERMSSTGGVDVQIGVDAQGNITETPIAGATPKAQEIQMVDKIPYAKSVDAQGNVHLKMADGFTAPEVKPFDETSHEGVLMNTLVLYNQKKNRHEPTTPQEDMAYNAAYYEKFHPTTSTVNRPDGRQDTLTNFIDPPSDFRVPEGQGAPAGAAASAPAGPGGLGGVPPDLAGPAQPQTATAAAAAAANPPAVQGKPLTVKVIAGEHAGEELPVKNYGGWTAPGEKPPVEMNTVQGPAGTTAHTITGDVKERIVTDSASKGYELIVEAIPAAAKLNEYGPGGKPVPSNFQTTMANWDRNYVSGDLIDGIVDQDTREYLRAILTFINMPKRVESGAAVNLDEVRDYITKYTMAPGSKNVSEYLSAKAARNQQLRAQRLRLGAELKSDDLQIIDKELGRYGQDIDWTPPTEAELNAARTEIKKVRRVDDATGKLGEAQ